jgi:hypothetical protein
MKKDLLEGYNPFRPPTPVPKCPTPKQIQEPIALPPRIFVEKLEKTEIKINSLQSKKPIHTKSFQEDLDNIIRMN